MIFKEENLVKEKRIINNSPSGLYKIVIDTYKTGPKTWDYSVGRVYKTSEAEPIYTIERNYGAFPFCWIEDYDGEDYLLASCKYMGFSIYKISEKAPIITHEMQFCPAAYTTNEGYRNPEDPLLVLVEGCYWAHPYELYIYNINPAEGTVELIADRDAPYVDYEVLWQDGQTVKITEYEECLMDTGESWSDIEAKLSVYVDFDSEWLPKLKELDGLKITTYTWAIKGFIVIKKPKSEMYIPYETIKKLTKGEENNITLKEYMNYFKKFAKREFNSEKGD